MSYFSRTVWIVGVAVLAVTAGWPLALPAQSTSDGTVRTAGATVNFFETLDPTTPIDGGIIEVPVEWTVEEVRLLRYGTEPVSVQMRSRAEGEHLFTTAHPVRGPHELVLRVRLPEQPGRYEWGLRPLVRKRAPSDSSEPSHFREIDRMRMPVEVERRSSPNGTNRAFALDTATTPLLLPVERLPSLAQGTSFTVEFWMRTHGLDEVVLSTWTGDESVAYPVEFVVDRSGRLRFYTGRPGRHRALRTGQPVADGKWHHVAAVYEASDRRLRLLMDGTVADSLQGSIPASSGPFPVAIGGRVPRETTAEKRQPLLFSGLLDELRIWGKARSLTTLRFMKSRPLQSSEAEADSRSIVRLGFESDERTLREKWPEGARRKPVALSFRSSFRNLHARSEGRSVTLRWTAVSSNVQTFVVERSTDGSSFSEVARMEPSAIRKSSPSESPEFVYTDENVQGQVVYYRIRQRRADGSEHTSGTIKIGLGSTEEANAPVQLIGNFPNPFSKTTTVAYEVREPTPVTITVWDLAGHRIAQLVEETKTPGYHETSFSAADLPSGTYFARLETPNDTQSHRMVVLK